MFIVLEITFNKEQLNTINISKQSKVYESVQHETSLKMCDIVQEEWEHHQW